MLIRLTPEHQLEDPCRYGAAGGIEAVFSVLALHHGILPPTINLDHPDPVCDLDYIPHRAVSRQNRLQDAQKGRPARPQRAKRRGVRFGTLSL